MVNATNQVGLYLAIPLYLGGMGYAAVKAWRAGKKRAAVRGMLSQQHLLSTHTEAAQDARSRMCHALCMRCRPANSPTCASNSAGAAIAQILVALPSVFWRRQRQQAKVA